MTGKFYLIFCCFTATAFFCCDHSGKGSAVATAADTLRINNRIKAKQTNAFAVLSDSVKLPSPAKKSRSYFPVTRFYYDSVTKELFCVENIFPATGKPTFIAYFDKGRVVKTIARTEFGWYDYYFSPEEADAADENSSHSASGHRNRLRQQCFKLAEEQLAVFQHKVKQ